jgi:hypothetical protein
LPAGNIRPPRRAADRETAAVGAHNTKPGRAPAAAQSRLNALTVTLDETVNLVTALPLTAIFVGYAR